MSRETPASDSDHQAPDWVDEGFKRHLDQGFEVRAIAVNPQRLRQRQPRVLVSGIYDYVEREYYKTKEDERRANKLIKLVRALENTHGMANVAVLDLPSSIPLSDRRYPRGLHRVVMARPQDPDAPEQPLQALEEPEDLQQAA